MYQANENEKLNYKLHRNIGLDYLHTLISNLNMQSSIWVLYLAYMGMNLMQIGLLEGIYHAASIVCEIPSGAMADLLGRRRSMLISRVLLALSCIIMLFGRNFGWFALSFILQSIGNSFNSGSEEALVYDSMKCLGREQEYMKVNGRMNVIIEVAQALATVAGGILAEYSYFWCYAACTVVALLALAPILLMTEPPIRGEEASKPPLSPAQTLVQHFRISGAIMKADRRILNVVAYYSAIFAAQTLMFYYSQQYFADLGLNKIEISLIMLAVGVVSCAGALSGSWLFDKMGTKLSRFGAFSIAVCIACYVLESLPVAILVFLIANFFNSALYPVQSDSLNRLVPSKQRATLLSVNSMFFSLAMILAFPLVGALADRLGLPVVFAGLGILLMAATGLTVKLRLE
ncbi:MAG: MFS transporter [Acetatifactor sp.]